MKDGQSHGVFTNDQRKLISDALAHYKITLSSLWKKLEKLGRKEAPLIKQALLDVEQLRGNLDR